MRKIIFAFLLVSCSALFFAQSAESPDALARGLEAYARSDWTGAIVSLKKAVVATGSSNSEAWYWLVMAEIAAADYPAAGRDADYFLAAWPNDARYGDMVYQKGRILYLSARYNDAVRVLGTFLTDFPDHPFAAAGYFWIGESLFALGRFDEAAVLYSKVVNGYALSVKKEAANYRLAVINQKGREEELLEILKWSHEESLKVVEEYQKRERSYEQALSAYQKRIAEMQETTNVDTEQELGKERLKNAELQQKNTELQKLNAELLALSEKKYDNAVNASTPIQTPAEGNSLQDVKARLDQLRKRAVELEESAGI